MRCPALGTLWGFLPLPAMDEAGLSLLLAAVFDPDPRLAQRWILRPRPSYLPHPRRRLPRLRLSGVVRDPSLGLARKTEPCLLQ